MKVSPIKNVSFGRALTSQESKEASSACKEALSALGCDKVIMIVPETSFPSQEGKNIGVGQLNSDYSSKFCDFLQTYTGANSIKVLPQGEYYENITERFYGNYSSSGLTLGTHNINLEELASKEMDCILSKDTLNRVYEGAKNTPSTMAAFENVSGSESNMNKALFEAFSNFTKSENLEKEKQLFSDYKKQNFEIIEKRALFECLSKDYKSSKVETWNETDRFLFDTDKVSDEIRTKRIQELHQKHSEDIDFVFFKQYLADKNLAKARENLHKKGMTLTGDCLIGFSPDEHWAYPKAFENATIGPVEWNLKALNFSNIAENGSASNNLLKLKVGQFAKRYDNIRFDVGWAYIDPILHPFEGGKSSLDGRYVYRENVDGYRIPGTLSDKVLNIIEDTVKTVKGDSYKKENLFYEIEAGANEFSAYDWRNNSSIPELRGRTIVQSTFYMNNDYANIGQIETRMRIPRNNYILMAGNHDHLSLNALAQRKDTDNLLKSTGNNIIEVVENQLEPLSKDLHLDKSALKNSPEEFVRAKFAYNFLAQNIKMFFMDVFGRSEQFDSQDANSWKNYRYRLDANYEREFHTAVQNKKGLNIMDALAKALKARNLDKSHSSVYNKLVNFANILYTKGALTEAEANQATLSSTISTITKTGTSAAKNVQKNKSLAPLWIFLAICGGIVAGVKAKQNKQNQKTNISLNTNKKTST